MNLAIGVFHPWKLCPILQPSRPMNTISYIDHVIQSLYDTTDISWYPLVIKHGWLENPLWMEALFRESPINRQHAMVMTGGYIISIYIILYNGHISEYHWYLPLQKGPCSPQNFQRLASGLSPSVAKMSGDASRTRRTWHQRPRHPAAAIACELWSTDTVCVCVCVGILWYSCIV